MLLVATDARFEAHDPGRGHPERPARLQAVVAGLAAVDPDALRPLASRRATRAELELVHTTDYLDTLEAFCANGGGHLDADTAVSPASWEAALLAAGSGIEAAAALDRGEGTAAFCAVRPPGHHAVADHAMGFCLVNNVAVTAATLRERGEKVMIVDWDAHHGNGTQDSFWSDPSVLYVSLHEWPLYPGTGRLHDIGAGPGAGATVNFPLPGGATGDVYLDAIDEVVAPVAERFAPDWLLISAGFDAHRADPLTGLGLSAGDYADLTAPPGRTRARQPNDRVPRGRLRPRRAAGLGRRDRFDPFGGPGQAGTGQRRRTGCRCGSGGAGTPPPHVNSPVRNLQPGPSSADPEQEAYRA